MPLATKQTVRYRIHGVEMTGTIVGYEREPSTGRWLYQIEPAHLDVEERWTPSRLYFSEFQVVPTEVRSRL